MDLNCENWFSGLIVGITGDITKSEEEFEEAGIDKILKKPCRPNSILATLASSKRKEPSSFKARKTRLLRLLRVDT